MKKTLLSFACVAALAAFALPSYAADADAVSAALAAADRPEWETTRDEARNPEAVLLFLDVEAGDTVVDIGSGGGYFARLISTIVGDDGHVYAQNPQEWVDAYGANMLPALEHLTSNRANVSTLVAPIDDLGFEADSIDAVTMALIYHDIALLETDRADMWADLYTALRPGGVVLITDHHSANADDFVGVADSLHRGNLSVTEAEATAAGFEVAGTIDALENDHDDLTLNVFDPAIRGHTSRFVIMFRKPE